MLHNISIGNVMQLCDKTNLMASIKKKIPSAFYWLPLLYLFENFPNTKHIAYNWSSLPGWHENDPREKRSPSAYRLHVFFPPAPVLTGA